MKRNPGEACPCEFCVTKAMRAKLYRQAQPSLARAIKGKEYSPLCPCQNCQHRTAYYAAYYQQHRERIHAVSRVAKDKLRRHRGVKYRGPRKPRPGGDRLDEIALRDPMISEGRTKGAA